MKVCYHCANCANYNVIEKPNLDPQMLGTSAKHSTVYFIRGIRVEEVFLSQARKCDWCHQFARILWRDDTPFLRARPFTLEEYNRLFDCKKTA